MTDQSSPDAVLRPTYEEFHDFGKFVERNSTFILNSGIVKVVPPKEWVAHLSNIEEETYIKAPRLVSFQKSTKKPHYQSNVEVSQNEKWQYKDYVEVLKKDYSPLSEETTSDDTIFWKAAPAPYIYSVDNEFSLFKSETKHWNLNSLNDAFSEFSNLKHLKIPGVTSPFVYIGSRFSVFCAHKEDMDLWSLSYLHSGSPKQWYGVPAQFTEDIEKQYQLRTQKGTGCKAPERHKHLLLEIGKLPKNVKITSVHQEAGTFVIAGGGCFHQGFNWGLNVAEAINFAPQAYTKQPLPREHSCGEGAFFKRQDFMDFVENLPKFEDQTNLFKRQDLLEMNKDRLINYQPQKSNSEEGASRKRRREDEEDPYVFSDEDDALEGSSSSKKRRGRPRKEGGSASRPLKECPFCKVIEGKNWRRHLLTHLGDHTEDEINEACKEASRRTVQGLRRCNPDLLPDQIKDIINKNPAAKFAFERFLSDIGSILPERVEKTTKKKFQPVNEEKEVDSGDIDISDSEATEGTSAASMTKKTTKYKLKKLGYPELELDDVIIKALLRLQESKQFSKSNIVSHMLTPIRRILGYVKYSSDLNGWLLLTQSEKMKEYIQIIMTAAQAEPSTAKNYVDHILRLQGFAEDRLFQEEGMPVDPTEHHKLMNNIKSAKVQMADMRDELNKIKDKDLAEKKWQFGKNLPNISDWENYLEDPEVLEKFNSSLSAMETASQEMYQQLESNPADSPLRETFNFIVEYIGTSLLFLAARPGELAHCTLKEIKELEPVDENLHVLVAEHKTGRAKKAVIEIPSERKEVFYRYVSILDRFSIPPKLGFPFLSPSKGFCEHTNIYRRLNNWLSKKGLPLFTCTKMRKTMETNANLHGTRQERELVGSGLNHSQKTIERHYLAQTTEKNTLEKQAIKKVKDDAKLRDVLSARPPRFPLTAGLPFSEEELQRWASEELKLKNLKVTAALHQLYMKNWQQCISPVLFQHIKVQLLSHKGKESYSVVKSKALQLLSHPNLLPCKADILNKLRQEDAFE